MPSPRLGALGALPTLLVLSPLLPLLLLLLPVADAELDQSQEEELGRVVAALEARRHAYHLLELARQKQRGLLLDDLPERPSVIDALQRPGADPLEYVRELDRQRLLPYLEFEPAHPRRIHYSPEDELRARLLASHLNRDPLPDYPETQYAELERTRQQQQQQQQRQHQQRKPAFTFSFERAEPVGAVPFAYRPNDPRYYDDRSSVGGEPADVDDEVDEEEKEEEVERSTRPTGQQLPSGGEEKPGGGDKSPADDDGGEDGARAQQAKSGGEPVEVKHEVNMLPEPQRRAELQPIIVKLEGKSDLDAYFTWLVALGSGVLVFALVITTLTWCRFQREAKAAADVEYPAYGVTGPNKDISPSGDQRLAQSAQMYHFQHQKQQIIAMEKASSNRDPGSVSDAESEEENEEGDYTVYECPGLAPTGEMEVKNPLFHEEPTPATPKPKADV